MKKTRLVFPYLLLAAYALTLSRGTILRALADGKKIVVEGRVADKSHKGVPDVGVTVWRGGIDPVANMSTPAGGRYRFEVDAGEAIDVSYHHSALGSAAVSELSGLRSHRIGLVVLGDPPR